ncbi:MAG: hypothetical protein ACYCXY_11700, partial [Acidimicrobiales bacterium]
VGIAGEVTTTAFRAIPLPTPDASGLLPACRGGTVTSVRTYANAYMLEPGRCFRFVENDANRGQPMACRNPVAVRGQWRVGSGKLRLVEACAEHEADLEVQRPADQDATTGTPGPTDVEQGRPSR